MAAICISASSAIKRVVAIYLRQLFYRVADYIALQNVWH